MDMKKYAGSRFLKFEDVKDAPRVETIAEAIEGRFEKANLIFESGDKFSLNKTNCRTLVRAFGENSCDWIGRKVELVAGEIEYQGAKKDSVLIRPVPPQKNSTPITTKAEPGLDDQIPF